MTNLSKIVQQAIRNDDSHGFYCVDCEILEFTMDFSQEYQVKLLDHEGHTIAHHSRITSAGSTCEMNAQPLISKNGVLLHNGTCQNDRVNNVIKEVKLTLRQEISDSVAMNLLLRETPTDKLLDTLQTFNQDDFIGNLLYIRNKTIYIHAQYGTIDIEKGVLHTAGNKDIYGTFDIETKSFDVEIKESKVKWYYSNSNTSDLLACGKPLKAETCLNNIYHCSLHGCSQTECFCNTQKVENTSTCINYNERYKRCDKRYECAYCECDYYNCFCNEYKEEDRISIIDDDSIEEWLEYE